MGLFRRLKDSRSQELDSASKYELPTSVSIPVDGLMTCAMMLVVLPADADLELQMRQRISACAFGATDWLCQAQRVQMNELEWLRVTIQVTTQYLLVDDPMGGKSNLAKRYPGEAIGVALAEVARGEGYLADCIRIGAMSMRSWLLDSNQSATVDLADCIMRRDSTR